MKKKMRIMVLSLAVSFALMGAGYAAWGVNTVSNTTVKTGLWKVFLESDAANSIEASDVVRHFDGDNHANYAAPPINPDSRDTGYDSEDKTGTVMAGAEINKGTNWVYTIAPTLTDDTVNFKFYNLHPGTEVRTDLEIRNKGTIPAKIQGVKVTIGDTTGLTADQIADQNALANALLVKPQFAIHHGSSNAFTELTTTAEPKIALSALEARLTQLLVGKILMPMETMTFTSNASDEMESAFHFELPGNALEQVKASRSQEGGVYNSTAKVFVGSNTSLPIKIEFDLVQYNEMPHVDTPTVPSF